MSEARLWCAFDRTMGLGHLATLLRCCAPVVGQGSVGKADFMGWAVKLAPAEDSGPFLNCVGALLESCGSDRVALAEWLTWLEKTLDEVSVETKAEPKGGFGLFDACCCSMELVEVEEVMRNPISQEQDGCSTPGSS